MINRTSTKTNSSRLHDNIPSPIKNNIKTPAVLAKLIRTSGSTHAKNIIKQ